MREVADAGGRLAVAGDRIRVSAPRPLPDRLVDALRRRKGEVIAYLGRGGDAWGTDEWRQWIAERAAILEHDGGLSRPEADGQAFQHAIVERLNRHPAMTDPRVCAGCKTNRSTRAGPTGARSPTARRCITAAPTGCGAGSGTAPSGGQRPRPRWRRWG